MLSVTIFGWDLSTTIVEGSTHYIVDDNVYKMFGYTNKSRVGNLKELCFSKAKTYPFILCESGEVLSSTENERKSSHRLQPGDRYTITPSFLQNEFFVIKEHVHHIGKEATCKCAITKVGVQGENYQSRR